MEKGVYERLIDLADYLDEMVDYSSSRRQEYLEDGDKRKATLWEGRYRAHLADLAGVEKIIKETDANLEKIVREMEAKYDQEDRSRSGGTSRGNRTSYPYP